MPLISVVVVTWNNVNEIVACLESVESQSHPPIETIVIDNASLDGTADLVSSAFPQTQLHRNTKNEGFSKGCNQGFDLSKGDFILFLNPDVTLAPSYVEILLEGLENDPTAGSAGGKLYLEHTEPRRLDSTGILLDKARWHPHDRGHGQHDNGQFNRKEYVFGVTAAAAIYRCQTLEECRVEGEIFDEDFFAYYEDVDLAWRAQLLGWRSLYVPEAVACHPRRKPKGHPRSVAIRSERNRYLLFLKNEQRATVLDNLASMIAYELGRSAKRLFTQPDLLLAIPQAVMLAPRMWRKRRRIQERVRLNLCTH
jgi:GT2 family glycosyltransferase